MFDIIPYPFFGLMIFGNRSTFPTGSLRSVVFVCKLNLCRSPFAEKAFLKLLDYWNIGGAVEAMSAGIIVPDASRSPEPVRNLAHDFDIDLSGHTAKQLTKEMVVNTDLVVALDREILNDIKGIVRGRVKHARLLSSFSTSAGTPKDIEDPHSRSIDKMRSSFLLIEFCLEGLVNRILENKQSPSRFHHR